MPILPAIEVPADIAQLNALLPKGRGSFDSAAGMEAALDVVARMGLPAIPHPKLTDAVAQGHERAGKHTAAALPDVASPVTVMGGLGSAMSTPLCSGGSGGDGEEMSAIDAAVAAALREQSVPVRGPEYEI